MSTAPVDTSTPSQDDNKKTWEFTQARMANLQKAREKAALLRQQIRDQPGDKPVKKPTKLEQKLKSLRDTHSAPSTPSPEPVTDPEPIPNKPVTENNPPPEPVTKPIPKNEPVSEPIHTIPHVGGFKRVGSFYFI